MGGPAVAHAPAGEPADAPDVGWPILIDLARSRCVMTHVMILAFGRSVVDARNYTEYSECVVLGLYTLLYCTVAWVVL